MLRRLKTVPKMSLASFWARVVLGPPPLVEGRALGLAAEMALVALVGSAACEGASHDLV